MSIEPLLDPSNNRMTVYPIEYPEIWKEYKKQRAADWTVEELDFSKDYDDFQKLNDNEKHFIKMVLSFFANSDAIVNMNLGQRFSQEIQIREILVAYDYQKSMENIHNETYSLQIENIIKDNEEKEKTLNAIKNFPSIKKKADWALKWIESRDSFAHRLLAFAIVEGVFFSGAFCAVFWIKKRNLMPGLCSSNELIARDETMHCQFACLLYSMLKEKLDEKTVHDMFREAYEIENEFICDSLPCSVLGMNSDLMSQYIRFVSDRLLVSLNYNKIWNDKNPFDFMESQSTEGKTNFFEHNPTQYQKASVLNTGRDDIFTEKEDF
jgi:ribonucleotide reductase beta subunit family protein with ferritin-like domain